METPVKYALGFTAIGAVLAAQAFAHFGGDDETAAAQAPTSRPSVTIVTPTTAPPTTPTAPDGTTLGATLDPALIESVARTYGEFSYTDPLPYSWMDRYKPLCTEEWAASLNTAYPFTKVDEVDWQANVVAPQADGRVVNVKQHLLEGDAAEGGPVSYAVTFTTQIRYQHPERRGVGHDGGDLPAARPGQWISAGTSSFAVVFVQEDGLWKVDHQERYAPTDEIHNHPDSDTETDTQTETDAEVSE